MTEKYYTPEADEFCIGSTYYMPVLKIVDGNPIETGELGKIKIKDYKHYYECFNVSYDYYESIDENEIKSIYPPKDAKMKYLDKEDIESCGFQEYAINWFRKRLHTEYPGYCYILPTTFHGKNSWLIESDTIILNKDSTFNRNGRRRTLFNGNIKNLYEFKKLLKMLGI